MDVLGNSLNVTASVASVIAAFRDADVLVQKLKMKRAAIPRAPLPPALLEDTIYQAPLEIERAMKRGVERFPEFERGDYVAVINIQQITIVVRSGLIEKLRGAVDNDNDETDFMALIDMADSARDSTLSALIALRQRLIQSTQRPNVLSPPESIAPPVIPTQVPPPVMRTQTMPTQLMADPMMQHHLMSAQVMPSGRPSMSFDERPPPRKSSMPPPLPFKDFVGTGHLYTSPRDVPGGDPSGHRYSLSHKYRPSEVLGILKRLPGRVHSNEDGQDNEKSRNRQSFLSSITSGSNLRRNSRQISDINSPVGQYGENSTFTFREVDSTHFEIWAPDALPEENQRTDNSETLSVVSEEPSRADSTLSSPASTAPTSNTTISGSTRPTQFSSISRILATPTPENDYLGFCKGAWKVQNEERKAMVDRRDFTMSAQSDVSYPSCKHCAFKGHLYNKIIWDKVVVDEDRGLKYRWTFLAKSHVKQRSVKEKNYAYQCLFCVCMGQSELVIYSQNAYLDHVNKEHRGINLDDVVLYRTRCINNRVCGNNENFDINLFPPMKAAAGIRQDAEIPKEVQVNLVPVEMSA